MAKAAKVKTPPPAKKKGGKVVDMYQHVIDKHIRKPAPTQKAGRQIKPKRPAPAVGVHERKLQAKERTIATPTQASLAGPAPREAKETWLCRGCHKLGPAAEMRRHWPVESGIIRWDRPIPHHDNAECQTKARGR